MATDERAGKLRDSRGLRTRGGQRDRRGIRAAAPQRGHPVIRADALKPRHDGDLAIREARFDGGGLNPFDARP